MVKILVIEDSNDLRKDIVSMLELEGYEAYGAVDGIDGVDTANRRRPDLIICDVMMPGLDGFGVLEVLHSRPETATIPVIFLTAKASRDNVRHGMVLGADDYLTKPFKVDELLDSIQTQLKKRSNLTTAVNQRLEKLRQNIITALPHELRTPLNTIIGFSDMLVAEADHLEPEMIVEWSKNINESARRLHHLVENYLLYAKLQVAQQHDESYVAVEPFYELASILEMEPSRIARAAGRDSDLQVDFEIPPAVIIRYRDAMKMVSELVDNAFKFSEPGQPVSVVGRRLPEGYELCIGDQGRGITDEQFASVGAYMQYERFVYEQQGMGFGLAIVRLLATLYEMNLEFKSNSGEGTSVYLRFRTVE